MISLWWNRNFLLTSSDRKFSLETIICALEKNCSDASLGFITSSLKKLVEDGKSDNLVLSYALSSLLCIAVTRPHSSSLVSTIVVLLGVVKLFAEDVVHSIIVHYCELPVQKHSVSLSTTVAAFFIANYHKQVSTFHLKALCKVFVHGLGKQESQAQTVVLIQTCLKKADDRTQRGTKRLKVLLINFLSFDERCGHTCKQTDMGESHLTDGYSWSAQHIRAFRRKQRARTGIGIIIIILYISRLTPSWYPPLSEKFILLQILQVQLVNDPV